MATEVHVRVVPGGLMCLGAAEASKIEDLRGRELKAKLTQPRNPRFHRLFFAALKAGLDMADLELSMESWRAMVTCGAGHCDFVNGPKGLVAVPRSIAWATMDETEFHTLYNDVIGFICREYLHGTTPEELDEQAQFMAFL